MKRFGSWALLGLCWFLFYILSYVVMTLAVGLANVVYSFSRVLFWVIVVLEGAAIFGVAVAVVLTGSVKVVEWSQKIWKSRKGTRYRVAGILILVWEALNLFPLLGGFEPQGPFSVYLLSHIASAAFGVGVIFAGKDAAAYDGPPPTEREILEARLKKLDEKEAAEKAKAQKEKDVEEYKRFMEEMAEANGITTEELMASTRAQMILNRAEKEGRELTEQEKKEIQALNQ